MSAEKKAATRIFGDLDAQIHSMDDFGWPLEPSRRLVIDELSQLGITRRSENKRVWTCRRCGKSHRVVTRQGRLFSACEDAVVEIASENCWTWTMDPWGLGNWIRQTLDMTGQQTWKLEPHLLYLGDCNLGGGAFPIWMFCESSAPGALVCANAALQNQAPDERGVILVGNRSYIAHAWPRSSKAVLLSDVMSWRENKPILIEREIRKSAPSNKKGGAKRGRPPKSDMDPKNIFCRRALKGVVLSASRIAEARRIREIMVTEVGEENALTEKHISEEIAPLYTECGVAGFPKGWVPLSDKSE